MILKFPTAKKVDPAETAARFTAKVEAIKAMLKKFDMDNLPELTGTERQVAWAKDIREGKTRTAQDRAMVQMQIDAFKKDPGSPESGAAFLFLDGLKKTLTVLTSTSAHEVIENR